MLTIHTYIIYKVTLAIGHQYTTLVDGILLSSFEVAKYFMRPAALGSLKPGHGITYRPSILYGSGK